MTFKKINNYTVQCVMALAEIDQMGYALNDLYTNREVASSFMRSVMEKGVEAGFQLNQNLQEIQVILLQDGQLLLRFTEISPDYQVNHMIESAIEAYEAVASIGKENLEKVMNMSGREKLNAFQEMIAKYKGMTDLFTQSDEEAQERNLEKTDIENNVKNKLMFQFSDLSNLEKFCKAVSLKAPSHLYKDDKQYYLLTDLTGIEIEKINSFIVQALDYVENIEKNKLILAYVEEHAENMIEDKAIEIMKRI